jgi:hypothetical protein
VGIITKGSACSAGGISGAGADSGGSTGFREVAESVCRGGLNGGGIGLFFWNNRQDTRPGVSSRTTSMTRSPALILTPA